MMKKLLVLLLVLGMASVASAALTEYQGYYFKMGVTTPTETIYIGDTVGVEILAGTSTVDLMLTTVLNVDVAASISPVTVSIPGDWAVGSPYVSTTAIGDGFNVNVDGFLPAPISPGSSIYSFSFTTLGAGIVTIDAVSGSWTGFDAVVGPDDAWYSSGAQYGLPYAQITVIPEPMTVVLLGLGGLFLRRRK